MKTPKQPQTWRYRCPHCRRVVSRSVRRTWIPSYCTTIDRVVRLQRVKAGTSR